MGRLEDGPLLGGEGWFIDDLDPLPHIAEAAAVDRVRYVGEPVAVVVARDRYVAERAGERCPKPVVARRAGGSRS